MSQYGILLNGFWDGETGRAIAAVGGSAAQLAAVYLMQNPDANMIGLYPLRLVVMRERIHTLSPKALEKAMTVLGQLDFAYYDVISEFVWVREMAKFRLGMHLQPLKAGDKRVIGANTLYRNARPNPFLPEFFKRYRKDLHLSEPRPFKGPSKVLGRAFEAPSKPVTESETGSGTGIRDQKQQSDQVDQKQRALARDSHSIGEVQRHLTAAAWRLLEQGAPYVGLHGEPIYSELSEELKVIARRDLRATWDYSREIGRVIDAVLAQYARRRRAS